LDEFDQVTTLIDVSIDDQEGVYIKIPSYLFVTNEKYSKKIEGDSDQKLLQTMLHNKTVAERIYDDSNNEMRWVMKRLLNKITPEEFRVNIINSTNIEEENLKLNLLIEKQEGQNSQKYNLAEFLIDAVEDCVTDIKGENFTKYADLFVVEAIFRNDSSKSLQHEGKGNCVSLGKSSTELRMGGLKSAITKFNNLACNRTTKSSAIAWGNTNSKPSDYIAILEAAERSARPVYFIPFIQKERFKIKNGLCLPWIPFQQLINRNVKRLYNDGRYVPIRSILEHCSRVERLMTSVEDEVKKLKMKSNESIDDVSPREELSENGVCFTKSQKLQLDSVLAKKAGFRMHGNRTVTRLPIDTYNRRDIRPSFRGGRGRFTRGGRGRFTRGGRGRFTRGGRGRFAGGGSRFGSNETREERCTKMNESIPVLKRRRS